MFKPAQTELPPARQRGRPRKGNTPHRPSNSTLSVGNCRVDLPSSLVFSLDADGLSIKVSDNDTINIKVSNETPISMTGFSFTLLNPKTLDGRGKLLLQKVLELYSQELPAMNYAANTGKESRFLENCILSGKYCTLILRNEEFQLIGAMSYQILPTDAHQAELPLAAVAQSHHRKGFGAYLFKELQRRLLDVGVLSIFCWGDQESEAFWAKQGFVTVAEVDGRGKPWKLPIKADVRRAMSIPGSATLMISYLTYPIIQAASPGHPACALVPLQDNPEEVCKRPSTEASPARFDSLPLNAEKAGHKLSPPLSVTTPQVGGEARSSQAHTITPVHAAVKPTCTGRNFCASVTPLNMEGMLSSVATEGLKDTVSKQPVSPIALAKNTRLPLVNISNTGPARNGATRPPKKRPFIRAGQDVVDRPCDRLPASGTTITLDKLEETVSIQEDKDSTARPGSELEELPISGRKGKARLELGEQLQVATSRVIEEAEVEGTLDKENECSEGSKRGMDYESKSARDPDSKIGVKRGRESQAQMKVFGRRSTRSRKVGPVPCIPTEVDETKDQRNEATEESMNKQDEDGLQFMVNLLLPQLVKNAGGCSTADVTKSATGDPVEPKTGMNRTTSTTNLVDHPIVRMDGEGRKVSSIEASSTGRSAEAPAHQMKDIESSASLKASDFQGPLKAPLSETRNSSEAMMLSKQTKHVIMFMNMTDENQKKQLTKYVERLGGEVTCNGCQCTHVVTGEVRRTLNFCVAISSGAWILSPDWLKISVKQKTFADEARFILRDKKFQARYKVSVEDVIFRARQRPNLLLDGMYIFPTPHIHPPVDTISLMVKAAGGKILGSLEEALQLEDKSYAAAVACEEDMSDAMSAAKAGLRTFSSDWLLTCIVKQELELTATQFSESL